MQKKCIHYIGLGFFFLLFSQWLLPPVWTTKRSGFFSSKFGLSICFIDIRTTTVWHLVWNKTDAKLTKNIKLPKVNLRLQEVRNGMKNTLTFFLLDFNKNLWITYNSRSVIYRYKYQAPLNISKSTMAFQSFNYFHR